jgi:Na+/phosphate symporter
MITKTIISRNPNGQISITSYDDRDNYDDIVQKHITNLGREIVEVVDGVLERPESREHRDCWDFKGGKIEVDAVKVQEKVDAIAQETAEYELILAKAGLTKEEAGILIEKGRVK